MLVKLTAVLAAALLGQGAAYPASLSDCRALEVGGVDVMYKPPVADTVRSIIVTRQSDSSVLSDGGTYIAGESLKIAISQANGGQYIFEANTDAFTGTNSYCTVAR